MPILPETAENWQSYTKRGRPPWRHMLIPDCLIELTCMFTFDDFDP